MVTHIHKHCLCGSGLPKFAIHDARGIFLTYVCDRCRKDKLSKYRKEVMENHDYDADEDIEEAS